MLNSRQVQDTASLGIWPFITASDMLCISESAGGYEEDHLPLGKEQERFLLHQGIAVFLKEGFQLFKHWHSTNIADPAVF